VPLLRVPCMAVRRACPLPSEPAPRCIASQRFLAHLTHGRTRAPPLQAAAEEEERARFDSQEALIAALYKL
jgi:hypothetical protein